MNSQKIKYSSIPDCEEPNEDNDTTMKKNTASAAKTEEIAEGGEHETVPKVLHSVFTSSRRDTEPFPDMSLESLPLD
jgi:hypothetical protein